jgi:hypothetical protein
MQMPDMNGQWMETFTEREQQEIRFSQTYARKYGHGTDGHNAKLIIAKMAGLLNGQESRITELTNQPEPPPDTPVVNR